MLRDMNSLGRKEKERKFPSQRRLCGVGRMTAKAGCNHLTLLL